MKTRIHQGRACLLTRRGFTILELAVVLGIISLIAGAGITMATEALKAADRVGTQERLNTIKIALDSFSKTYGYLPCPASRVIGPTNTSFGVESRSGTNCTAIATGVVNVGSTTGVWLGALPVRTLGLPDNYASDTWGAKLDYAVSAPLIAGPTSYSSANGTILIRRGTLSSSTDLSSVTSTITGGTVAINGTGIRVTYTSTTDSATGKAISTSRTAHISSTNYKGSFTPTSATGTTVDIPTTWVANDSNVTITWQEPGAGAAYVVVSHGPDGRGGFTANGTSIPTNKLCNNSATANSSPPPCTSSATTTCIDIENCDDDNLFFDTTYNDGTQASLYFDDYIVYGSNDAQRGPVNPTVYTTNSTSTCVSTCEPWCAACDKNYPGGGTSSIPPTVITSGAVLCRKVLRTGAFAAPACNASCFWGGVTSSGYLPCP